MESAWFHDGTLVFKFRGVDSISDAEPLAGAEVRVPLSERTPLEPGEFFQSDLIGCEVVDRRVGRIAGPRDRLGGCRRLRRCWKWTGGLLIPFARAICVEIDPAAAAHRWWICPKA